MTNESYIIVGFCQSILMIIINLSFQKKTGGPGPQLTTVWALRLWLSLRIVIISIQGRRHLQAKEALFQAPPKIGGPRFVISVKFSIRLLKAREERKPNKVIEKSVLIM